MSTTQAVSDRRDTQLRAGSLSLWQIVALGLAYMSLAPVIYFNMGLIESLTGQIMPFVFLLITVAVIPTAISFALMNNRRPSAGSAYTWLWESTVPAIGLWLGWILTTAYFVVAALYPPIFGLFFNSFLDFFGIGTSYWTAILGGIILVAIVAFLIHRDVQLSAKAIAALMVFEAGFVALLALYIVVRQGADGELSLGPFNPSEATAGFDGVILALVFAFLSIAGIDSVAPVAEEAKAPRSIIPRATILVTVIAGLYYALVSYGFAVAVPVERVLDFVAAGEVTPVYPIADEYIGVLRVLVPITGFTAAAASFAASVVCGSRLLYAVSREGFAPAWFGKLHPTYQTPWNAARFALGFALVFPILMIFWQDRNESLVAAWIGQAFVFFILIPYIFVNFANLLYHWRYRRDQLNVVTNVIVPILGAAVCAYILYRAFFDALLELPFKTGKSIVIVSALWALLGVAWAAWTVSQKRSLVAERTATIGAASRAAGS
jgi:putrescine importer